MPIKEWKGKGGIRLDYADWRKELDKTSWFSDLDYVEYRDGRGIVALFEVTANFDSEKHMIMSMPKIRMRLKRRIPIFIQLASAIGVPFYLILHNKDLTIFHVYTILYDDGSEGNLDTYVRMNAEEHKNFIQSL